MLHLNIYLPLNNYHFNSVLGELHTHFYVDNKVGKNNTNYDLRYTYKRF